MSDFQEKLSNLDIGLFDKIPSQSTDHDRASLLACQLAVGELVRYLVPELFVMAVMMRLAATLSVSGP